MARSYAQYCGLAHALDLVGERWALLIVRELLAGPRRYTDLKEGLIGAPSNVLATRLREMEANGLLSRRRLPPPASSVVVYELSDEGERLGAAILELTRWGMRTLPAGADGRAFRSHWLVLALQASFDADAAVGVSESYELEIVGEETVAFEIEDGDGRAHLGPSASPAVRIRAEEDTLLALTAGGIDPLQAIARGAEITGEPAALARMRAILPPRRALEAA